MTTISNHRQAGTELLDPAKIIVRDNRKRQPGNISELAEDMARIGQLEPIGVNRLSDVTYLVYGARRLEAANLNGSQVECLVYEGLTERQEREAELTENLQRADLTELERAEWLADLKSLLSEPQTETDEDDKPRKNSEVSTGGRGRTGGNSEAARMAGVNEKAVRNALKISALPENAKQVAKDHGLDDIQSVLLEAAKVQSEGGDAATHLKAEADKRLSRKAALAPKRRTETERELPFKGNTSLVEAASSGLDMEWEVYHEVTADHPRDYCEDDWQYEAAIDLVAERLGLPVDVYRDARDVVFLSRLDHLYDKHREVVEEALVILEDGYPGRARAMVEHIARQKYVPGMVRSYMDENTLRSITEIHVGAWRSITGDVNLLRRDGLWYMGRSEAIKTLEEIEEVIAGLRDISKALRAIRDDDPETVPTAAAPSIVPSVDDIATAPVTDNTAPAVVRA